MSNPRGAKLPVPVVKVTPPCTRLVCTSSNYMLVPGKIRRVSSINTTAIQNQDQRPNIVPISCPLVDCLRQTIHLGVQATTIAAEETLSERRGSSNAQVTSESKILVIRTKPTSRFRSPLLGLSTYCCGLYTNNEKGSQLQILALKRHQRARGASTPSKCLRWERH